MDTFTSDATVHDIPDHERPETWTWIPTITFWREGSDQLTSAAEIRKVWNEKSEMMAEPFRSALLSLPEDAIIWSERLSQWPTIAWDNKQGSVTLAGDAAHPMTYRKQYTIPSSFRAKPFFHQTNPKNPAPTDRGQGLNNAIHDAAYLGRALNEHCENGTPLTDVLASYEAEVVERGNEAVLSSGQNSVTMHDWEHLMESPMLKHGAARLQK